jgi:hypothetical protein
MEPPGAAESRYGRQSNDAYSDAMAARVVLVLLVSAIAASCAEAMGDPYTATATDKCLTSHHVLVSRVARVPQMPVSLPAVATLKASFALIPSQALDSGVIVFEQSPAKAQRVAAAWFAIEKRQLAKMPGVDLSKIQISLRDVFTVSGNTITTWYSQPVKPASRRLVAGCLR